MTWSASLAVIAIASLVALPLLSCTPRGADSPAPAADKVVPPASEQTPSQDVGTAPSTVIEDSGATKAEPAPEDMADNQASRRALGWEICRKDQKGCMEICCRKGWACAHSSRPGKAWPKCIRPRRASPLSTRHHRPEPL